MNIIEARAWALALLLGRAGNCVPVNQLFDEAEEVAQWAVEGPPTVVERTHIEDKKFRVKYSNGKTAIEYLTDPSVYLAQTKTDDRA